MKYITRITLAILFFLPFLSLAQETAQTEMADTFRAEGKIYVVIAVMTIILIGLFIYLFSLGKKVSDLEKKLSGKS